MRYNKLIRDKIPEEIRKRGAIPITRIVSDTEYLQRLKDKLQEEVAEFLEDHNEEELADILEVIHALRDALGISEDELEETRKKKAEKRGRFRQRIVLEEIEEKQ